MKFEDDRFVENFGKRFGYVFGYFLFTTFLFLILVFSNRLPRSWNYFDIVIITLAITVIGITLKRLLR